MDDDALELTNLTAGTAGGAWLSALGLAAAIDELRFAHGPDPIPAPGLDARREVAGRAAIEVAAAAETVRLLTEQDEDDDDPALQAAVERVLDAGDEVERATRALAQLALGVTQPAPTADDIDLLERSAVAVLAARPIGIPLYDEPRVELASRTAPELEIEVAGLICRLLVDHTGSVELAGTLGTVELTARPDESLEARVTGTPRAEATSESGWTDTDDGLHARWESPMVVIEIARLVVRALTDLLDTPPLDVRVHASR